MASESVNITSPEQKANYKWEDELIEKAVGY
jgi:hypothetical protein